MGIVTGILIGAVVAGLAYAGFKSMQEDQRRRDTPCLFNDGITREEFSEAVDEAAKPLKRLQSYIVVETTVHGTVISQSGQSEWTFSVDFNDYGHISGKYWIRTENNDSNLPECFAKNIQSNIFKKKGLDSI